MQYNEFDKYEIVKSNGKKLKNGNRMFLSVCSAEESEISLQINGSLFGERMFFCIDEKSEDEYEKIRECISKYIIKYVYSEDWDPSFGYSSDKNVRKEGYIAIKDENIVLREGFPYGIIQIEYTRYGHEWFKYNFTRLEQADDGPIYFGAESGYGSSDKDMLYSTKYYLSKVE